MRRLAIAIALSCVLSSVGHAGEIHSTGAIAPPPAPRTMTTAEETNKTGVTISQEPTRVLTIVLTLISIVR